MSLKTHNFAKLEDQEGINPLEFEVNYDKDHRDYIKVTLANKVSVIKRDDLWNFVFTIVKADQQQQMIPVIKQEMVKYIKQHTVELQKDMKKGEIMAVNCQVNVKKEIDDAIRREIEEESRLSTLSSYVDNMESSV